MKKLILLHGALGSENDFQFLRPLLENCYNVYSFNFSGHGGAAGIENNFSIEQFAFELADFIKEKKINDANIFGYSMGGYVALYYAYQFPDTISKIFTLGTKFNWTPAFAQQQIKFLHAEKILEKAPRFADALAQKHQPNDWKIILEKTAFLMRQLAENPLLNTAVFSEIPIPVKIAIGDKDEMVTHEESEAVVSQLPTASFEVLPATPHPIEKVGIELLAQKLKDFFN